MGLPSDRLTIDAGTVEITLRKKVFVSTAVITDEDVMKIEYLEENQMKARLRKHQICLTIRQFDGITVRRYNSSTV